MKLESLPNELLHEIFEFLDIVDIFRAFHNLNGRFNTLLFTYFHAYRVNLHSILKYQSDFPFQHYLPLIVKQIISLRLSDNNEESLPQTYFFFSSGLFLNQFIHLRSLSLYYIDVEETLCKLIVDCHQLPRLTHLKVVKCHTKYRSSVDFGNVIWGLPNLTHCYLHMQGDFCMPTIISSSLEYLSISCQSWNISQTAYLFQQTPHLRCLHAPLNNQIDNPMVTLPSFLSITTLKLSDVSSLDMMRTMLFAVPNLTYLKVDAYYTNCDGYVWEEIIDNHLPKLKAFHLRMHIQFRGEMNNEQRVDFLVESFRTRFWLEKHRWHIHCRYLLKDNVRSILLYTVPYAFHDFDLHMLTMPYRSTYPQDIAHHLYNTVNNFRYDSSFYQDYSFIQFFNIRNLSIHLPFAVNFWQIIPTLHTLNALTVLSAKENAQFHLQSLLDQAPSLYSLTIRSWLHLQVPVVKNANASLRRLDIRPYRGLSGSSFFNNDECNTLIHSPLAMHCEELLINVKNHESILDLVNNMSDLRILHIQYEVSRTPRRFIRYSLDPPLVLGEDYNRRSSDVFVEWLQAQFPAACIIPKFKYNCNSLKLWIYLKKHIVTTIYIY